MPIKIPDDLPAKEILNKENIFLMNEARAQTQDIRPLRIVIFNLMPNKIDTETQLLRLLGNTPLQIEIELLKPTTYRPKNTPEEHLLKFYKTFDEIKNSKYDGMIITGAPVEKISYEEVAYWEELCAVMEWTKTNVFSTLHICWGALAALYYHHGIPKEERKKKIFGVFKHKNAVCRHYLLSGFDDIYSIPHSRYAGVSQKEIEKKKNLQVLSLSQKAGVALIGTKDGKQFFITGHPEYERDVLKKEYERDLKAGLKTKIPKNYFPNDDPKKEPVCRWKSFANLLFSNWLNYFVYQETPYDYIETK